MKKSSGFFVNPPISFRKRKTLIADAISIYGLQDGFILNKDGSIAVGFEVNLFEEELLNGDGFTGVINDFSAACKRLPNNTVVQKFDIYHEKEVQIPIPKDLPFFHKKTLDHYNNRKFLAHSSFIFLRFFSRKINPLTSFDIWGDILQPSFKKFSFDKTSVESTIQEFLSSIPTGIRMTRLNDQGHEKFFYRYINLVFDREPIGFESSLLTIKDSVLLGSGHLKCVEMKSQAQEVFDWSRNSFGNQGVTSPFMGSITHYLDFPHIVCQQIEIINDQKFRKSKNRELEFIAKLNIGARGRELAEYVHESFLELEKELNEKDSQIVKLNYNVLVWHPREDILQPRVDQVKSAFGKLGIQADETSEETAHAFLSNIPGGTGFSEGLYMPLETAVAYLNFITPRKGDKEGILLSDRHGYPIYYDPFKYSLDNQHAFVFGPTGSGKSFFNGKMIKDRYYAGHTMVVIDSGGTYRLLFEALGGKYIEYDPEKPLALNPFLVKKKEGKYAPDSEKIAFLVNFIAKIWKGDLQKNPLSEVEYALLAKFLKVYYESLADSIPTLAHFCKWLEKHLPTEKNAKLFDLDNFLIVIEPFTEGIYKDHFNSLDAVHIEDEKLLCFELEAVKSNAKLYPLVIKVLFDYVLQLVATHPEEKKFIDIEEGWTMLDDSSQDYIETFFRKGRKTNTSIRIITQNIDEIKDSAIAGAMKNNASTFILLYNDKESVRQDIAAFLGMNEFDQEKYASLMRKDSYQGGFREIFIKEMDKSAVWAIETSLFEHAILTSRPDERNAINRLKRAKGNLKDAVIEWVEGISKEN